MLVLLLPKDCYSVKGETCPQKHRPVSYTKRATGEERQPLIISMRASPAINRKEIVNRAH
jgi:hypothetical protein